jgi:UDP-2-acetamido-3-amino-2,3-dideoxy-glucuronate N-acetyltransferase
MEYKNLFKETADPAIGERSVLGQNIAFDRFVKIGKDCQIGKGVIIGFNTKIGNQITIADNVSIGDNSVISDNVTIGKGTRIENNVEIGYANLSKKKGYFKDFPTQIGENCIVRSGSVIYLACKIGENVWIGNYTILRENTTIGNNTTFGSHIMCEGYSEFGNNVKIYSFCELGGNMLVEDYVFIGPGIVTANNPRPLMGTVEPTTYRWADGNQRVADKGPTIRKGAKIGISSTLLAEIEVGKDALVAAGSVVTKDVPDYSIVKGVPAQEFGTVPEYERLTKQ